MQKNRLFIFDFDGTVVDSEPNYDKVKELLWQEWGLMHLPMPVMTGIGTYDSIKLFKEQYNLPDAVDTMVARADRLYMQLARANTPVFPKVKAFIETLKQQGYPMVIASGTSLKLLQELIDKIEMRPYFEAVFSAEQVAVGKPDPALFLLVAKQMGYTPENCVVLEDSLPGVQAAKNAKMPCIALPSAEQFNEELFHTYPLLTFKTGYHFNETLVVKTLGIEVQDDK